MNFRLAAIPAVGRGSSIGAFGQERTHDVGLQLVAHAEKLGCRVDLVGDLTCVCYGTMLRPNSSVAV
jgi:Fe-S oxidoreductase